jgi:hypothetical protein
MFVINNSYKENVSLLLIVFIRKVTKRIVKTYKDISLLSDTFYISTNFFCKDQLRMLVTLLKTIRVAVT